MDSSIPVIFVAVALFGAGAPPLTLGRHLDDDYDDNDYEVSVLAKTFRKHSGIASQDTSDRVDALRSKSSFKVNCSSCEIRESLKASRIDSIKKQILEKLRLEKAPNVSLKDVPPMPRIPGLSKIMNDVGKVDQMISDAPAIPNHAKITFLNDAGEGDGYHANINRAYMFAGPGPNPHDRNVIYFNLEKYARDVKIKKAKLGMYLRPSSRQRQSKIGVRILVQTPDNRSYNKQIKFFETHQRRRQGRWLRFTGKKTIRQMVQTWISQPKANTGFKIEAGDSSDPPLVLQPLTRDEAKLKPYLELEVEEQRGRRTKRAPDMYVDCKEEDEEVRCCRYPLTVDFEKFGWDWIIAPKVYQAYYCSAQGNNGVRRNLQQIYDFYRWYTTTKGMNNRPTTQDIISDYIADRLSRKSMVQSTLQPSSNPVLAQTAMRTLGQEFEQRYSAVFTEMGGQLSVSPDTAEETFYAVVDELFREGVRWGRIVALFVFSGTLAERCVVNHSPHQLVSIVDWVTNYIDVRLCDWMTENGGWEGFVEFFETSEHGGRRESAWPSLKQVCSSLAVGAISVLTLGAIFKSQRS